jgi:DNA-binding PadR family transcriptional regulator
MNLDLLLLGRIAHRPASGYDLARDLREREGHVWWATSSQIYSALGRMQTEGWLQSDLKSSRRGPPRKVYGLTSEGRGRLEQLFAAPLELRRERHDWLAHVRILGQTTPAEARRALEQLRQALLEERTRVQQTTPEPATPSPPRDEPDDTHEAGPSDALHEEDFFRAAAHRGGLLAVDAQLNWCEETLAAHRARHAL